MNERLVYFIKFAGLVWGISLVGIFIGFLVLFWVLKRAEKKEREFGVTDEWKNGFK